MQKLINLLNEYEGQDTWSYDEEMGMPYYGWGDDCDYEAYLISKKYGFVSWLVENEKVKPLRKFIGWEMDEDEPYIQFDLVDQYIAYLAIQDEPIRFLCEILK